MTNDPKAAFVDAADDRRYADKLEIDEQSRPQSIAAPTCSGLLSTRQVNQALQEMANAAEASPQSCPTRRRKWNSQQDVNPVHVATSTFFSLVMVLAILLLARWMVPPLVEGVRYGWYRGQLRAEYEVSGQQLKSVSLESLADVSRMVSQRLGPSVVHINVKRPADAAILSLHEGMLSEDFDLEGQGSGFVIDEEGYILTNQHVLEGATAIEVTLSDGRRQTAELVGMDLLTDLAVIRIKATGLMPIDWGDSDEIIVGTPVWAVGSPFGLQQTVTFGIISGKHRVDFRSTADSHELRGRGGTPYGDLMQSDVALNPGNSGGPLVNTLGQVIGVNAAILGETFQGVSFSIPSKVAVRVAGQLIENGEVPRGWLGVRLDDLTQAERFLEDGSRRDGARVGSFPSSLSSPGRRAGLKVGDVIVSIDGNSVENATSLIRMIGETPAGSIVRLGIERPVVPRSPDAAEQADSAEQGSTTPRVPAYRRLEIQVRLEQRASRI